MNQTDFRQFVDITLERFKTFISWDAMPTNYDICLDNTLKDYGTFQEYPNQYMITLNPILLQQEVDWGESILFHEFTHFYDHATLLQDLSIEQRDELLRHYTEFHAAFVQMQCACKFPSATSNVRISVITQIPYEKRTISCLDFYVEKAKLAAKLTKLYCTTEIQNSYTRALKQAMFYAGEIWCGKCYADFDVDRISDLSLFAPYLSPGIEKLAALFMTNNPINIELLQKSTSFNEAIERHVAVVHIKRRLLKQ